jgi:hypothetical protein
MSQPLLVSIPHRLGRLEARRRLDSGFGLGCGRLFCERRSDGNSGEFRPPPLIRDGGRPDPVRRGGRSSATLAGYRARHAGSGQGLPCRCMALFTPGQAAAVRDRRRLPVPTTGSPDCKTVCSPASAPSRKCPAWLASRPDRVRKRAPGSNIRDSIS